MPIPGELKLAKHDDSNLYGEERLKLAMQLLDDLIPLKKKADESGLNFLSYLLGIAVMETHSIASGADEAHVCHCEICGSAVDVKSPGDSELVS